MILKAWKAYKLRATIQVRIKNHTKIVFAKEKMKHAVKKSIDMISLKKFIDF